MKAEMDILDILKLHLLFDCVTLFIVIVFLFL